MSNRIAFQKVAPESYNALIGLGKALASSAVTKTHQELIKIRASQINGCAFCINMHTTDARKSGETEQRIYLLNAWRETDLYTEEEKAILALTEEVTLINNQVSDETYQNAAKLFDEKYLADVLMGIIIINGWNRMAITTGLRVS